MNADRNRLRAITLGLTVALLAGGPVSARQDGRFEGNEYFGDAGEGFFGDPSSGYHGMPLLEPDIPPRAYRVAKDGDTAYLKLEPARIIEFDPRMYGD